MIAGNDSIADESLACQTAPPQAALLPQWRPALAGVFLLTVVTGVVFPLVLAAIAQVLFRWQSDGSLLTHRGKVVGSDLIGQPFVGPAYFHPRPSAAGNGYDTTASGGSNLGPTNPRLAADVRQLAEEYRRLNDLPPDALVPIDAVTRSGSGLDPHISPANAALQLPRVARLRGLSKEQVGALVAEHTQGRQFGFLGEPRVSVLALNLALDRLTPHAFAP